MEQAIVDPSGVAVLGFFYEVNPHFQNVCYLQIIKQRFITCLILQESQSANKKYDGIINSLTNITHPGKVILYTFKA